MTLLTNDENVLKHFLFECLLKKYMLFIHEQTIYLDFDKHIYISKIANTRMYW